MSSYKQTINFAKTTKMTFPKTSMQGLLLLFIWFERMIMWSEAITCYSCNEFPAENFKDCSSNTTLVDFGHRKDVSMQILISLYKISIFLLETKFLRKFDKDLYNYSFYLLHGSKLSILKYLFIGMHYISIGFRKGCISSWCTQCSYKSRNQSMLERTIQIQKDAPKCV